MSWGLGIDLPMPFETRLIAHEYALGVDVPVVRSSDEAWEAFARASEEFRTVLNGQRQTLTALLADNVFGDCVEGLSMHDQVSKVLRGGSSITSVLSNQSEFLRAHADSCRQSAKTMKQTDEVQ